MKTPTKEQLNDWYRKGYVMGFEDALALLDVPRCPKCGSKMTAETACGEDFIVPVGITEGKGCEFCRHVPMHNWIKQVLEDWKKMRDVDTRVEEMCKNNPGIKDFEDFNRKIRED